jgi:hypothetical protein
MDFGQFGASSGGKIGNLGHTVRKLQAAGFQHTNSFHSGPSFSQHHTPGTVHQTHVMGISGKPMLPHKTEWSSHEFHHPGTGQHVKLNNYGGGGWSMSSGQDDAVLGATSGRRGGHAGFGQEPHYGV